jgi:hypothetical protein
MINYWNEYITSSGNWRTKPSWFGQFYDFTTDEDITACVYTQISSGTCAVSDAVAGGGVASFANSGTTDDSGAQLQVDAAPITLSLGKTIQFKARAQQSDATQSDLWAGIAVLDTSLVASAPTDGIYFRKDDGVATWKLVIRTGSADELVSGALGTNVAATWQELAFEIAMDAVTAARGVVKAWIDDVKVYEATHTNLPASTVFMSTSCAWQSGEAAAKTMYLDYFGTRQSR